LRAGARFRSRPGAVRAHQTVRRSHAGRLPGLFAALRVRAGGAAQPAIPALRSRAAVPVPFPRQQPRDAREAAELLLAGVLRAPGAPRSRSPVALVAPGGPQPRPPRLSQGRGVNCLIRMRAGPMVESLASASR